MWLKREIGCQVITLIQKKRNKDVDFETDKEYQQIGTELAIDTKKVLMLN